MSRRLARELIFQILFQIDIGHMPWQEAVKNTLNEHRPAGAESRFVEEVVRGIVSDCRGLDDVLSRISNEWTLSRMAGTDRSILRLAAYELLYRNDIPAEVSVNEAVELAKKYGEEDSGRFVNGILGALIKKYHLGKAENTRPEDS